MFVAEREHKSADQRSLAGTRKTCEDRYDDRLLLLSPLLGKRATKAMLSGCVVVIAARMRCAIAAERVGVPRIFLSHSSKSLGMAEYVYSNSEWVIPVRGITATVLSEKTEQILAEREAIRCSIPERRPGAYRELRWGHWLLALAQKPK